MLLIATFFILSYAMHLKHISILILFVGNIFLSGCINSLQSKTIYYKSLNDVMKERFEIEDKIEGFLNNDEYIDFLYVIRINDTGKRRFLICFGKEDNQFEVMINSDKCILNKDNQKGTDPYISLEATKQNIKIIHAEKENPACLNINEFYYNEEKNSFFLTKKIRNFCPSSSLSEPKISILLGSEKININDFDIEKEY